MNCNELGHKSFDENCVGCKDFEECFKKKLPALNKYVAEQARLRAEKFKSDKRINDEIIGKYDILKQWRHNNSRMQEECPYCSLIVNIDFMPYLKSYKDYVCCPNCFTFMKYGKE